MFSFDQAQLPKVFSRKAFIGVNFQNDFTSDSGALKVTEPKGYVERAVKLAESFRACGNPVIWTKSSHGAQPVPVDDRILATDAVASLPSRGRRRTPGPEPASSGPPDAEAFLSHLEPSCLKPDSKGSELATEVRSVESSSDVVITNSDYSAFKDTALLRLLRSKMVMEVYICGSLVNVGVYATAIEAAGHGIAITIVDDCSGYRSEGRQTITFSRLNHLTGCDIISAKEVCQALKPVTRQSAPSIRPPPKDRKPDTLLEAEKKPRSQSEKTSDLSEQLSKLRLEPKSLKPVAGEAESADTRDKASTKAETSAPKDPATPSPASMQESKLTPTTNGNAKAKPPVARKLPDRVKEMDSSAVIEVDDGQKGDASDESPEPQVEEQKGLCAGDTDVIENVLPRDLEKDVFEKLRAEVSWQRMSHQGGEVPRLVAVQGEVGEDGSMPVYRHPSDESPPLLPFTTTVRAIKEETEKHLGHPLNHVLIQFYRDGNDYISEHSDKTIDVVKDSYIANVSLGAQRTMVLRTKRKDKGPSVSEPSQKPSKNDTTEQKEQSDSAEAQSTASPQTSDVNSKRHGKKDAEEEEKLTKDDKKPSPPAAEDDGPSTKRQVQRATLRHNSLCRMGLKTNMQWLHSIRQDKRADRDKSEAELAFDGGRISLTFRRIGTFLNSEETMIWGQGATGKTKEEAHAVINGESPEMVELLKAFGRENHSSTFDWNAHYGKGFDVLHMSNAPRFFASRDALINGRISLMLAEYGIGYAKGSMTASKTCNLDDDQLEAASVKFVDSDAAKSVVQGDMAIMLYLHRCYGPSKDAKDEKASKSDMARKFTLFQKALTFLTRWRRVQLANPGKAPDLKLLKEELSFWDKTATSVSPDKDDERKGGFLSGGTAVPGLTDFALWPVVNDVVRVCGREALNEYSGLMGWFERVGERDDVKSVVGVLAQAKA